MTLASLGDALMSAILNICEIARKQKIFYVNKRFNEMLEIVTFQQFYGKCKYMILLHKKYNRIYGKIIIACNYLKPYFDLTFVCGSSTRTLTDKGKPSLRVARNTGGL